MTINLNRLCLVVLLVILGWGCSNNTEKKQAVISAQFSVADSVQSSGDLSGIGFTIIKKDSANAAADTLFYATTDSAGSFSGTVRFDERRQYRTIISRNGRNLGRIGLILADGDSIRVRGTLPNLSESFTVSSEEHDAMKVYERVNRNFQRVRKYASAGRIQGDSLRQEILKWSNIFWDVYQKHKGTIASELAARSAIQILPGIDNKKMMSRLRAIQDQDKFSDIGATIGKNYIANSKGLNAALTYLDTLKNITTDKNKLMQIQRERINLLYDSARVDAAKRELSSFKKQFADSLQPKGWVESMDYDLNYMSPGDTIPQFKFTQNGKTISRDSLKGTPYILEITRLSNKLYQRQFDRTVAIHSIYKNFGLEVITIPLDESQVTVDAFFEERYKPWPVADAQAFDRQKLIEKFNIRLVPTRFLIDREGQIVRKYVGREYQDVINGIQTIIQKDKEPAS